MSDRLRRLDALFAEKVLGCKVQITIPPDRDPWPLCGCEPVSGLRPHATDWAFILPYYTRSLDAAWEGVKPTLIPRYFLTGPARMFISTDEDLASVCVQLSSACGRFGSRADASHPAEALVLACLRAVGVSEEELG